MNISKGGARLAGITAALVLLLGLVPLALGAEAPAQTVVEEGAKGLGNSKPAAFLFWLFAALTIGGSVFVITRRNMISAVMGMVGTFFCIAALYAMLYAHFVAVIQILVYAGAIMVLFVFVIMILNRAEDQPWAMKGLFGKSIAGLALLYMLVRVAQVLWKVKEVAPAKIASPELTGLTSEFGSTKAIGQTLFNQYLF
ncbi:MAG: NADH-quinone oxidoreductase subunit J, partial [Deltaproteobacteria bacterium]|nr:NADH-quinone oxidoreductase subunit J [Deltaproteobacteria bacterium]